MTGVYPTLELPSGWPDRPHVAINMVATIDGKIVTGGRDEPVQDLGSALDHATMRQIQAAFDGVMIGAGTLRSTPKLWYLAGKYRFVASRSGRVDPFCRFFGDEPERSFVVCSVDSATSVPEEVQAICVGSGELDFVALLEIMRAEMGIERLLVEGGSELNAQLFALDLIDEIFLTVAPKIKLGASTPTIADGEALGRDEIQSFELVSSVVESNELFLRYRRSGDR
jgi:riboflavin biosynthesis pyrimidine reductase